MFDASGSSSGARTTRESRKSRPAVVAAVTPLHGDAADNIFAAQPPPHIPHEAPPISLTDAEQAEQEKRGSRRVKRWLAEQRRLYGYSNVSYVGPAEAERERERVAQAFGTPCNPYLAYPYLQYPSRKGDDDDGASLRSYVIIEEEDVHEVRVGEFAEMNVPEVSKHDKSGRPKLTFLLQLTRQSVGSSVYDLTPPIAPYVPAPHASTMRGPRPKSLPSSSTWRSLPFAKTLPLRPSSAVDTHFSHRTPPQTPKKSSPILRRRSPIPEEFWTPDGPVTPKSGRVAQSKMSTSTLKATPETPKASTRFRLSSVTRPSPSSSLPAEDPNSPRPSTSNSSATATTSTAVENEERSATSRLRAKITTSLSRASKLGSAGRQQALTLGSPSRASFFSSTHTFDTPFGLPQSDSASFLAPPHLPHAKDHSYSSLSKKASHSIFREKTHNASSSALSTLSIGSIGSIATSIGGRSSVFGGATTGRRKKLVVSGIERDNLDAIEGLQKWCEVRPLFDINQTSCSERREPRSPAHLFTALRRTAHNHTNA